MRNSLLLLTTLLLSFLLAAQTTLVNYNSSWKYLANGSNQGTAWRGVSFNDASWASGNAELGYGDGDEATVVGYGPDANNKYITTYFRKTISIADASILTSISGNVKRDDGVAIYVNGIEVYRNNLAAGAAYNVLAAALADDDGVTPQPFSFSPSVFVNGNNVIAVEIHQSVTNSTDISFNLELIGTGTTDVTPPTVSTYSPADNSINVSNNANLVLTFSENIQKGTGNILVKEGGVTKQTIDVTSASVTVSGNTVTINPADFTYSSAVNIQIAAGAFKDLSNNNYAGIADATTWNFSVQAAPSGSQTLVGYGSSWKYLDNGTNQGTAWRGVSFNDASWASGNAELGYGDGDEATVVGYGPDANNKYITTYFRKTISIADASILTSISGNVKRDDGVAIYVNGIEVYRNNLAAGAAYNVLAAALADDDGVTPQPFSFSPSVFVNGNNVIAVEIHQSVTNSTDISFNLELIGTGTTDVTPPTVSTYSPADNSINVSNNANLVLTFSENIQKGTGNILVKEGGVTKQTIDVTSASVTVSGNTVTINPADFTYSSAVNIEIAAGAFKDLSNNNYVGINNSTTWNFSIAAAPDLTPPTVSTYSPTDNSINVLNNANLVLTFSENIQKGAGNILIKEGGATTQTIDVTSASVTVSGNTITINPADFTYISEVNIEIAAGAFKDLSNNNYAGIADHTTWNFSVIALLDLTPPTVSTYSPADNSINVSNNANLVLTFSENIQKGTGNILVKEGGVTKQTIDVTSASVTVSGNTVTINPADFTYSSAVNIQIAAGAFKDLSNNNYAGIADATTWNFSVQAAPSGSQTLVGYGSSWKYLDNGTNQGTAWRGVSFNDASWASGNVELGYGDGDEATVVGYGPDANNKYITTYFRKTISIADASILTSISGNVKRDDGVAIYVNGIEVYRNNLAAGAAYNVLAAALADDDGVTPQPFSFSPSVFVNGNNVIAVEIHQSVTNSTDISFNLELIGTGTTDVTPPTVSTYSPADNSINVSNNANLVLTFSENIQKGTGNILVKEGGVTKQTIDVTSASVTVSGNTVTINPADFTYSSAVNIQIAAGAFKDLSNNNYAGIADATTWNFSVQAAPSGSQTLVGYGSSWKYLDNGTNQGTAWRGVSFNDASWASGNAELGYGDGDEATVVGYGPDANNKYITTYFRKTISIADASILTSISGNVKRDDGVAIYVNGIEVYRNNLVAGAAYNQLAIALADDDGATPQPFSFSPLVFINGNNVIAVEIHQSVTNSTDISFNLELTGNTGAFLTRGPYLNSALQDGIVIRWRTDLPTNSKVSFGTSAGSLTQSFTDNTTTTEHIVTLTGLSVNTLYYYSVGSTTQVLQGDASNYFKTIPAFGSTQKIRVMAMGDMGTNSTTQINVRNAYLNFNGSNYTDAWLLLGDNAYEAGTDAEYQSNFFNIYQQSLTKNHVLWPAPGNHDYANSSARQADHSIAYYDIFSLPSAGQGGGVSSGTEAFYSYNYGNIHFVALDSYGWETGNTRLYDTLGPQVTWLKQDLAANTQPWTIVYFHHPPYTKGSHNSDTETELINLRQRLVRILERYKVDLVLNGHSHSYERSYLINGHYGLENTFDPLTHALSTSSAKYNGTTNSCTYIKNGTEMLNGIVYAVVGSAGQLSGSTTGYPHNAMYYSDIVNGGALFFEVEDNRLDAKWICADGVIRDNFTIMKGVNKTTNLTTPPATPTQLKASWIGNYSWSTGETTRTITISLIANKTYTVTDGLSCLSDVFNITISGTGSLYTKTANETLLKESIKVIPTFIHKGQQISIISENVIPTEISMVDINGRVIRKFNSRQTFFIESDRLRSGIYFIRMKVKGKAFVQKIAVLD